MRGFEGEIQQQPPPYSAKKVQGVKFYELARRGEEVPSETKEVTVYEFAPLGGFEDGEAACASGSPAPRGPTPAASPTTSAPRWGSAPTWPSCAAPGSAASGPRTPCRSPSSRSWSRPASRSGRRWIPFDQIPLPFGEVTADPQQEHRIGHGQTVLVRELDGEEGDWVKLINRRREFIAVGTVVERIGTAGVGIVQPQVVFR